MQPKKTPMRKCLGCGEMFPKKELVRVVKTRVSEADEAERFVISLDLTGKKAGRGAYVCKKVDCLRMARKARRIERALSCQIPQEVFDRMEQEMQEHE
ncbi:MAG: YlxR family protein [Clostridia bacterium]|nr:YlxR family protein [Clostridia bacterium]MBR3553781.1 YlxR family protein [Clostridia bacterium]